MHFHARHIVNLALLIKYLFTFLFRAEKDALHVEKVINSARMPKDRNAECVLQ